MTIQSFENVAVMGAGAVGCYFGAMLARGRATVRLIGRQSLVDAVARDGLRLESAGFSERVRVAATTDPAGVSDAGLVLFCVKSLDTEEAARAIAPHLRPGAVVLGMQNGVDNFQRMRAYIGNDIVPTVVYVAAEIVAPGCVRHNGGGDLVIGAPGPSGGNADRPPIAKLAGFLAGAGIPVRISDNIEGALWTKLMLNCAYNAVSALGRSRYARMIAMPPVRQVMGEAVAEIVALARAKRVRLEGDDPVEATLRIAETMPDQVSSTAQDIARGRRTEIDDLNGYVVRQSDALGLPAPVNRTFHALVKLLEASPQGLSS